MPDVEPIGFKKLVRFAYCDETVLEDDSVAGTLYCLFWKSVTQSVLGRGVNTDLKSHIFKDISPMKRRIFVVIVLN